MADDKNQSPITELNESKAVKAVTDGMANTAGQVGNTVIRGAGDVVTTTASAISEGDAENPALFYSGLVGKIIASITGTGASATANVVEGVAKTGVNTANGLLGDLAHNLPRKGGSNEIG